MGRSVAYGCWSTSSLSVSAFDQISAPIRAPLSAVRSVRCKGEGKRERERDEMEERESARARESREGIENGEQRKEEEASKKR